MAMGGGSTATLGSWKLPEQDDSIMKHRFPDHPFVRESMECPLCGSIKVYGHIACDDCFQEVWARGDADTQNDAEDRLDAAEAEHAMNNSQFGVGS